MALGTGISLNVVGLLGFDPAGGIAEAQKQGFVLETGLLFRTDILL